MTVADRDDTVDVLIVGAGPVGLTLANILGLQGVDTLVVDERDSLIDYPRGVGLDDEALRTFQSIGLVEQILPHTVPNQILRFFDAKRKLLAEMAPPDARFGWPKRNGFVQPMVDAELHRGLDRFDSVGVRWNHRMENCTEAADGVSVEFADDRRSVRARYVVGCDGGRSATRQLMGVSFDGTTSPTRWLVVDCANDPRRRVRRRGGQPRVRPTDACHDGSGSRARRHHPAPGVHPPLAYSGRIPAGAFDDRRGCSPSDARMAGPGLQQRHPRRREPRLEAGGGGDRAGFRRAAGYLRRRAAKACEGHDRPLHNGRPGHLTDEPTIGSTARQG